MAIKFTRSSYKAFSSICADIAQIFFGAFVAAIAFPIEPGKVYVVILYLGFSIIFWFLSVAFAERGKL